MKELYKTYNLEAFLSDDDFVNDVKQQKLTKEDLSHTLKDAPLALKAANQAIDFMETLKEQNHGINVEGLWNKIDEETNADLPQKRSGAKILPLYQWIAGVAAAFLLIMFVVKNAYNSNDNFGLDVAYGKEQTHVLPDGSTIYLNAGSRLEYNASTFEKERSLFLDGEAFFSVQKGQKFTVETTNGSVEVLGTTFNVLSRADKFMVECTSGKVKVANKQGDLTQILLPNQAVQFDGDVISDITLTRRHNWRNKKLEYQGASANFVIEDLSRQFDLNIKVNRTEDLSNFSGEIPLTDTESAIKAFTWPLRLNYTIEGKNVFIY